MTLGIFQNPPQIAAQANTRVTWQCISIRCSAFERSCAVRISASRSRACSPPPLKVAPDRSSHPQSLPAPVKSLHAVFNRSRTPRLHSAATGTDRGHSSLKLCSHLTRRGTFQKRPTSVSPRRCFNLVTGAERETRDASATLPVSLKELTATSDKIEDIFISDKHNSRIWCDLCMT